MQAQNARPRARGHQLSLKFHGSYRPLSMRCLAKAKQQWIRPGFMKENGEGRFGAHPRSGGRRCGRRCARWRRRRGRGRGRGRQRPPTAAALTCDARPSASAPPGRSPGTAYTANTQAHLITIAPSRAVTANYSWWASQMLMQRYCGPWDAQLCTPPATDQEYQLLKANGCTRSNAATVDQHGNCPISSQA